MCADFLNLKDDIDTLTELGADFLHIDIMDGHYVPNFTLGPDFVQMVHDYTRLPLDIHLMIENVDDFIPRFALDERCWVSFHPETSYHPYRTIDLIRKCNAKPGIAFEPALPFESYSELLDEVAFALVMTVSPGFAGQKLIPATLEKVARARAYLDAKRLTAELEVDGNVSWENIPRMIQAGATVLVAGTSSIYSRPVDLRASIPRIKRLVSADYDLS